MDRIEAMQAFVTVAELRGFAAAARKLALSPSGVTRLVASLEEHLSLRLLTRTTRSVALTDAGARYLERARRILADVGDAEAAARAERAVPSGRFVVAAPAVFGRLEVGPLLSEFLARHPDVRGELVLSDRNANLVEEGIDVAVRIGALADSSLHVRRVGATRRVLVASRAYLERRGKPRRPEDLRAHALVHFSSLAPSPEWTLHRRGRDVRVRVAPAFATNSADAAIGHAERGGGIAQVLSYQAREGLASGRLVTVLADWAPPPVPIQLVYPASTGQGGARQPTASVRAFVDLVVAARSWDYTDVRARAQPPRRQ